jgi:putative phage-type endonuclease
MSAPIIHRDIAQGSPEWFAIKAGKWSASKAAIIMGGLDTSGLASYIKDLAWERVYGPIEGGFKSPAMERGNEVEPEARDYYAFERGVAVEEVGCVIHADLPNVLWSPDGLIEDDGAIEAKSPLHKAWMDCAKSGLVPSEYRWQCKFAMWVGQLSFLDFVAYHPAPGGLIIPCEPSPSDHEQMAERIALLEPKVQAWVDILMSRKVAA